MDEERERKLASLRNRVRSQLKSDTTNKEIKKPGLLEKANTKILEKHDEMPTEEHMTISLSRIENEFQRFASSNRENEKFRNLAAFCILAGAILGMMSGLMQLTGNPAELVENSQFFAIDDEVDVSGIVLFEDGSEFDGMIIEIYDLNSGKNYGTQVTGDDGYFVFKDVPQRPMRMEFSEDGFISVHKTFIPDKAYLHHITMHEGDNDEISEIGDIAESELNKIVLVGTIVGVFTILFALLGVHAYFEVKRATHYRRTLYFAGLSMFSRGLIIVGPALTLIGMGFLTLAKYQFADQNLDS